MERKRERLVATQNYKNVIIATQNYKNATIGPQVLPIHSNDVEMMWKWCGNDVAMMWQVSSTKY